MNKNFKVVFSKARGALMVVNELTSSVQAKGTKTVIAAAVASLVAGGAMADTVQRDSAWVDEGASIVVNAKDETTFTGLHAIGDKDVKGEAYSDGTLTETAKIILNNGLLSVAMDKKFGDLKGQGKIVLSSDAAAEKDVASKAVGLTLGTVKLDAGSISFEQGTRENAEHKFGAQTLTVGADSTLGKATVDADHVGSAVTVSVAKDITANVTAGEHTLALTNVVVDNQHELTFTGANLTLGAVDMTKNAGTVTFAGAATANKAFVNAGKTVFTGETTFKEGFEGTSVLLKSAPAEADKADTVFKGNVTVNGTAAGQDVKETISTFNAKSVTLDDANLGLTVGAQGRLVAETVGLKAGALSVDGVAELGTVTVDGGTFALNTVANKTSHIDVLNVNKAKQVNQDVSAAATLLGKNVVGALNITSTDKSGWVGAEVGSDNVAGDLTATTVAVKGFNDQARAALYLKKGTIDLQDVTVEDAAEVVVEAAELNAKNIVLKQSATSATKNAQLWVSQDAASVNVETLDVQANANAFAEMGNVKVATLNVAKDAKYKQNAAHVTIGTLNLDENGAFVVEGGSLTTSASNILSFDATKKTLNEQISARKGVSVKTGTVNLTDAVDYTVAAYTAIKQDLGNASLAFTEGKVWGTKDDKMVVGQKLTVAEAEALQVADLGKSELKHVYTAEPTADNAIAFTNVKSLASVELVRDKTAADTVKADKVEIKGNVTFRGTDKGEVFVNFNDKDGKLSTITLTNNVNFGKAGTEDFGVIDNALEAAAALNVNGDLTVNNDITLTNAASALTVNGTLVANNVKTADKVTLTAKPQIAGGTVVLVGGPKLGADNKPVDDYLHVSASGMNVNANDKTGAEAKGGLLVIGKANVAAAQAYQEAHHLDNTLWIGQKTMFDDGDVTLGNAATGTWNGMEGVPGEKTVAIDIASVKANGYKAAETMEKTDKVVSAAEDIKAQKLVLANLADIDHSMLFYSKAAEGYQLNVGDVALEKGGSVDLGTIFYDTTDALNGGVFTFKADEEVLYEVEDLGLHSFGALDSAVHNVQFGQNMFADQVIFGLDDWIAALDKAVAEQVEKLGLTDAVEIQRLKDKMFDAAANKLVNEEHVATNLAAVGGAFNAALDVNDQVTSALNRRTSLANLNAPRTVGVTPWVDVFGTKNENKAYEADIYGAVLGMDYTASCGGVLGFAFNVGQADSNSANNDVKVDNSADFYGFGIYAAQTFGDFNVKADFGYTKLKNELSANTAFFGRVAEDLDSDVLTFGLGAEYLVKFGDLNVVPHAGLRMSRLSMDDSHYGAAYEDMTVYQMPMGVAFSGQFDMNGWKLAPMVDLAVVPAFGDKDAVASYFGGATETTRIVDTNPIQATLGLEAQNGAWTFGVNYGLTAGSDDRMNNALNANVRYTF